MPQINLRKFGVNDLAADLMQIPTYVYDFCANNNMTLRCRLDARFSRDYYALRMWELAARGITLLPVIMWSWDNGTWRVPSSQLEREALQGFCADIGKVISDSWNAGHPGKCQAVEIWNEPNLPAYGGLDASNYAGQILKPARTGIRSTAGIPIIVGGLAFGKATGRLDAKEFIQGLYNAQGVRSMFDAIGIHPYGYTNPTTWVTDRTQQSVSRAVSEIDRARSAVADGATLLVTETGRASNTAGLEHEQKLFLENLWIAVQARENSVTGFVNWHVQDRGTSSQNESKGLHRLDSMVRKEAGDWFVAINQVNGYPYVNLNQGGLD